MDDNVVKSALEAARTPEILNDGRNPLLVLPPGWTSVKSDSLLPNPTRATGAVALHDADSFVNYVSTHETAACAVYCAADFAQGKVQLTAVLNDHTPQSAPGWRDLRAIYEVRRSEEWQRWTANNAKRMDQATFATFLEDNMKDIATIEGMPTGSDILSMALQFEATVGSTFKSAIRLQSGGVDLAYVSMEDDTTAQKMKVFDRFALGVAPFFNGEPFEQRARLRYKIEGGKLALWYELIRPDLVVQAATKDLLDKVTEAIKSPVYYGTAG